MLTIHDFDYVVAARFHSVLLPLMLGIPTIGLVYHPKTRDLLAAAGHPEWGVDIDTFTPELLLDMFDSVREADRDELRRQLLSNAAEQRAAVEGQFDQIFG